MEYRTELLNWSSIALLITGTLLFMFSFGLTCNCMAQKNSNNNKPNNLKLIIKKAKAGKTIPTGRTGKPPKNKD